MPRAFMITHTRRFGDEASVTLSSTCTTSTAHSSSSSFPSVSSSSRDIDTAQQTRGSSDLPRLPSEATARDKHLGGPLAKTPQAPSKSDFVVSDVEVSRNRADLHSSSGRPLSVGRTDSFCSDLCSQGVVAGCVGGSGRHIGAGGTTRQAESQGGEKMMHCVSPASESRARLSSCSSLDSPPLKKRLSSRHRADGEKHLSCSSSDVDSDSGSSSQNEARHELPPELEYGMDCHNNFSLLFDLMTHSPPKDSGGREGQGIKGELASVKSLTKQTASVVNNGFKSKQIARESEPGEIKKIVDFPRDLAPVCLKSAMAEKHVIMNSVLQPVTNIKHMPTAQWGVDKYNANGVDLNVSSERHGYNARNHSSDEQNRVSSLPQVQRKISFEDPQQQLQSQVVAPYAIPRSASPNDEPIDYSQLSSRKREASPELRSMKTESASSGANKQPSPKQSFLHERVSSSAPRNDIQANPKIEFILSPTMDKYGNLVLNAGAEQQHISQSEYIICNSMQGSEKYNPFKSSSDNSSSPCRESHRSSFLDQTTADRQISTESKDRTTETHTSGDTLLPRDDNMPYHPKLKYLLAASRFNSESNLISSTHFRRSSPSSSPSSSPPSSSPGDVPPFQSEENTMTRGDVNTSLHQENQSIADSTAQSKHMLKQELFYTHHATVPPSSLNYIPQQVIEANSLLDQYSRDSRHLGPAMATALGSISTKFHPVDMLQSQQTLQKPSHSSASHAASSVRGSVHHPHGTDVPGDQQTPSSSLSDLLFSSPSRKPGVDPYACSDCGKRYSTSSNLARHRQTHRSVCDKKARKCPHCDKVYVSMPAYSMHVRTHNQGCECPHCGKRFSRPWLLQGHIRTHTGEKPFGCSQCGKSFADKSNLRAHIQTHSTDKPYVCGRCGKAFALKSYLYKHEESSCMRGQRFRP